MALSGPSRALHELCKTEQTYVARLSMLMEHFADPLSKDATLCAELSPSDVVDPSVLAILSLHRHLADELGQCADEPSAGLVPFLRRHKLCPRLVPSLQRRWNDKRWHRLEARTIAVANVLHRTAPFFKIAAPYILNVPRALQTLQSARRQSQAVRNFLSSLEGSEHVDRLDVPSLLILPVQQYPRSPHSSG